jgi:formylglycine-generating enzyme required for sulfatase activity
VNGVSYTGGQESYTHTTLTIGAYAALGEMFNGTIDEVMVYNRTLTSDEINATYMGSPHAKGETWNCTINATDSQAQAGVPNSTTKTISNAVPTMGLVSITPNPANTTDALNCSATGYDLDLDSLTINFTWYNGSTYYNSSTFATTDSAVKSLSLTAGIQASLETWNCTVFVNDGTSNSVLNSTIITIGSTSPTIDAIIIKPTTAYTNDTLNCSATYNDIDSDKGNITFSWYNGSTLYWQTTQYNKMSGEIINEPLTWINMTGLVAYYKFSEGNGTQTRDISGNENNGTLLNKTSATCFVNGACPAWDIGKSGSGLSFDGKGDSVDAGGGASFNITDGITVSAWVYLKSFDRFNKIAGRTNSYALGVNATKNFSVSNKGNAYFQIFNSTNLTNSSKIIISSQMLSVNTWYFLTGVYNGSEIRICVNGACNSTLVTGFINNMTNISVQIGKTATPVCLGNMSYVNKLGGYCIDQYEATCSGTGGSACVEASDKPLSQNNSNPWNNINWTDAKLACLRAGKYLCSDPQWLAAAAGTPDPYTSAPSRTNATSGEGPEPCHIWNTVSGDAIPEHPDNSVMQDTSYNWGSNKGFIKTGTAVNCTSDAGVYDMIGNMWEWTDMVHSYLDVTLGNNYIGTIIGDTAGNYNNDYYWTSSSTYAYLCYGYNGTWGYNDVNCAALRSGDWFRGGYAGRFALYLHYGPAGSGNAVGFRCCSNPQN